MAQPVWVLSVDLQTKTATFQTGMAEAAKSARGAFADIKAGADEMGRATGGSMMEARHGVMLLGEEFGVHLPRALTSFIASIGPVGAAMEAAFPFLAIIVGATLLLEHLAKLKESGEKLTESQINFGTAVTNVLNALDTKLLEAGIRTDELNHNHLGALHKQLELIDRQSLEELVQSFNTVAKAADLTFAQLKTSWYQFGAGSAGAKNALEEFKSNYEALLAKGKDKEANDLLIGTKQSAEHVLELQKQINANQTKTGTGGTHQGDYAKFEQAKNELKKQGIGYSEKEITAQETLVGALRGQLEVQEKINALASIDKGNARKTEQNREGGDSDKLAREQAQQQKIAAEEAQKLWDETYREAVAKLQENEREKIDATKQGSAARLAAIDAGIKEEESKGLQDSAFYRSLLTARVELTRQMAEDQAKLTAEAGKESAEHTSKMGELQVQADKDAAQLRMSAKRITDQERMSSELKLEAESYEVQKAALAQQIAALDSSGKEYENKLKALQDKQLELVREHENKVTQITDKAEEDRNARNLSAMNRANEAEARSLTDLVTRRERGSKILISLGDQVASGLIKNALMSILADDMTKPHDAGAAARKAFLAGEQSIPGIPGVILGGAMAAATFASVMAFDMGGLVPGVGGVDSVNARLTPGESVLPKRLTENLTHAARHSGDSAGETHIHHHQHTTINALDAEGMDRVLTKHADTVEKHFNNHVRKMNH